MVIKLMHFFKNKVLRRRKGQGRRKRGSKRMGRSGGGFKATTHAQTTKL
jgi:hypothetical protein